MEYRYKYYVVYEFGPCTASAFISTNMIYNTEKNITKLREYLSEEFAKGKPVIIMNIIKLKG